MMCSGQAHRPGFRLHAPLTFAFCCHLERLHDISAHPRQHEALYKRGSEPVRPLHSSRRREHVACAFILGNEVVHESRGWSLSPQERKISALLHKIRRNLMKNLAVFFALLVATTAPAAHAQGGSTAGQQQPPTLASVLNFQYGLVEQQVMSAAEAMPEEKYSFAPTNGEFKGVRTFAEQVKHIGFANHLFFGPLMGETIDVKSLEQNTNGPAELKTKAEIVQYLKDSFALAHRAIATITAENQVTLLAKPVLPFLNTRLVIANIGAWHSGDHYGQMVEYLRMNGIIPPASRPRPPQQQPASSQPKPQQ